MCGMKGTELGLEHENLGLLGDGKKRIPGMDGGGVCASL